MEKNHNREHAIFRATEEVNVDLPIGTLNRLWVQK